MKASANTFLIGGVAASVMLGSLVGCASNVTLGDAVGPGADSGAPDALPFKDGVSGDSGAPDGTSDAPSPGPAKYLGLVLASVDQSSGTNQYGLFADFTCGPLFTASPPACACSTGTPTGLANAPTAGAITLSSSAGGVLGTLTPSAAGTAYAGSFFATTTFGAFATVIEVWDDVPSAYPTGGSLPWTAGDALEVSAAGGDVGPFTATLQTGALLAGVTPALGSAPTVVSRNEPFAIAWMPGDRPTDRVDLTIRELTSNGDVTCSCTAPDSAGQIAMGTDFTSQLSSDPSAKARLSLTRMTVSNIWSGSTSVDLIGEVGLGTSATVSDDVGAPDAGPDGNPTP
jgi:hypothetical protein